MKRKKGKQAALAVLAAVCAVILVCAGALCALTVRSRALVDEVSSLRAEPKYQRAVSVQGVDVITQDISCGYAVIEMFGAWTGKRITEEDLYEAYGKVVTSTGKSFCREMNRQFPEYTTTIRRYLTDTELIDVIYGQLSSGIPVPFEWAAETDGRWTLHYSLVTGMDLANDTVTVANPYGYEEKLTVSEFVERTSFRAYRKMPLYLKLAFAFGIFEKNTVFTVEPAGN